ncbi:hypothetical protein ACIBMZ_30510 [Micromonospora sp. NPDC049900]|uniref:hypothetical protein n=1 Tax=Micromonospora sp. NPDC049900 TaxID=3364275 RepID=UPI0037B39D9A
MEHRLFVSIDVEKIDSKRRLLDTRDGGDPESSDQALMALARSRMLFYLALASIPAVDRRIVPIGQAVRAPEGGRPGATVTLLEDDPTTRVERQAARRDAARYERRPGRERLDMLIGRVPGTDLTIGMSRRLFAACAGLAQIQREIAIGVERAYPQMISLDHIATADENVRRTEEEFAVRSEQRRSMYWQQERELSGDIAGALRAGFTSGKQQSWQSLLEQRTPLRLNTPTSAIVEAATADTYLALDVPTVAGWIA